MALEEHYEVIDKQDRNSVSSLYPVEKVPVGTSPGSKNQLKTNKIRLRRDNEVKTKPRIGLKFLTNSPFLRRYFSRRKGPVPDLTYADEPEARNLLIAKPPLLKRIATNIKSFMHFVGPGILISVAYIDPGNYSTGVSAGALFRFKLLFIVLVANIMAGFLQSLCCKLGTVTGYDLARNNREHFPRSVCYILYVLAEAAIIATDLAEVTGSAIALNLLFRIPLPVGVVLTFADVMITLVFYRPEKSIRVVRYFESFVAAMVFTVVMCFGIILSKLKDTTASQVFSGFLPSKPVIIGSGIYQSVGIIGATVMPHSLFLGSGLVQARLRDYDARNGLYNELDGREVEHKLWRPSIYSIQSCLKFSILELTLCLFTFALFTNCSILIVAGGTLYNVEEAAGADLFSIYDLLQKYLAPAAGTVFAVALLMSGISSGIVGTMAGQFVAEGYLNWKIRPWIRRLIVRGIAIVPCLLVATTVGRSGLGEVLNASQVTLSILLPFLTAPLIYFTCKKKIMNVPVVQNTTSNLTGIPNSESSENQSLIVYHDYSNSWLTTIIAILIWLLISTLNVLVIVRLAMGKN